MFCEQVRRIDLSWNFGEAELFEAELSLHPKVGYRDVANFAKPATPTHSDCCSGVCSDVQTDWDIQVFGESNETHAL